MSIRKNLPKNLNRPFQTITLLLSIGTILILILRMLTNPSELLEKDWYYQSILFGIFILMMFLLISYVSRRVRRSRRQRDFEILAVAVIFSEILLMFSLIATNTNVINIFQNLSGEVAGALLTYLLIETALNSRVEVEQQSSSNSDLATITKKIGTLSTELNALQKDLELLMTTKANTPIDSPPPALPTKEMQPDSETDQDAHPPADQIE